MDISTTRIDTDPHKHDRRDPNPNKALERSEPKVKAKATFIR
jgi:hypothetical protein